MGDITPDQARDPLTTVATVVFAVGHSILAPRIMDGRRASSRLQISRDVASRKIPLIFTAARKMFRA